MDFNTDHFSLFELPASFRLDAALLDRRYLEMQSRVHPRPLCERW
jgi:DnaJ-domain-containing protein 1